MRVTAGLAAFVALLGVTAPARGQDDEPERSDKVDAVYRDYRDDGVIETCDHTRRTLQRTLDRLAPEADVETPDLRPALEAGIEQHRSGDCDEPEPTPTPTATAAPAPTSTPAPTLTPDTGDDSTGVLPPPSADQGGGNPTPPDAGDVAPLDPEVTPVPPAVTPAPAPVAPATPATPAQVYSNPDDELPVSLLVLIGLLALLALLALLYALVSRLGWGERRLAGVRRTCREARFRIGGTWGDFADWIRVGR